MEPDTIGVAIEVPLMVLVAVSLVYQDDRILEPGAKTFTQFPKLEKLDRVSVLSVAPTVMARLAEAGE